MKENDIDSYLRANRPQIKDNPTFLLEVEQKMRAIEGIKNEVDRQRKKGRLTMTVVFVAGVILGAIALALALTFPTELKLTDVSWSITGIQVTSSITSQFTALLTWS